MTVAEPERSEVALHDEPPSESGYGYTTAGMPFWPGTPCTECGLFVGRDGYFSVERFEMSNEIACVEATHRVCPPRPNTRGGGAG